jgi:hypothetical protein
LTPGAIFELALAFWLLINGFQPEAAVAVEVQTVATP